MSLPLLFHSIPFLRHQWPRFRVESLGGLPAAGRWLGLPGALLRRRGRQPGGGRRARGQRWRRRCGGGGRQEVTAAVDEGDRLAEGGVMKFQRALPVGGPG